MTCGISFHIWLRYEGNNFRFEGTTYAGITSWNAQITPIGTSVGHIDIEDCDTKAKSILVETPLTLLIEQGFASGKPSATPGIE